MCNGDLQSIVEMGFIQGRQGLNFGSHLSHGKSCETVSLLKLVCLYILVKGTAWLMESLIEFLGCCRVKYVYAGEVEGGDVMRGSEELSCKKAHIIHVQTSVSASDAAFGCTIDKGQRKGED